MITIYANSKKIYDPRIEELQLEEADLSQAKNKAGTLKLIIPADHAYSDMVVTPGITRVTVKEDEDILFKGRIIRDNPDFWEDSEYTAEGQLAYLNDTVVRPYEFSGSPREYFTFLITQHNSQVEKERQFTVGRVTVSDPNDYIVRSNMHYPTTFEELQEKLLDKMDCFLVERWEDGVTYLDCLAEIRENNEQTAQYGENIVDIDRVKEIDSGFATAIIPLGKKQEDENGEEKYLTIASVNNGLDYVQDDEAVSKYGRIFKTVEHEDVTLPENLLRKGKEDLKEALKLVESVTVTAADLSGTGVNVESFRFMKNVRCISKRHGLDFRSPIISLDRNLLDRSDYKITVGNTLKSYTGAADAARRDTDSKIEEVISLERDARKKAIANLVDKMGKASGLYVTDMGEGGKHNWYLHDKKTVEESYTIIQINEAGIRFSADGGKSYNGLSWDGKAILQKIYTEGIDARYINTGKLQVNDGNGNTLFCVDMETGEVLINNGVLKVGEGFVDSSGEFQIGPMKSVGENNDDVEFKKAIWVDYGMELLAGNDGSTPYIDFHAESTTHDNTTYDYTARIQNTQQSWITFYGLNIGKESTPEGCTVQAAQFRGTFVNDSDKRLKKDVKDLDADVVLTELMKYRPVSYRYINGIDTNIHHGLIAQEAQKIADWGLVDDRGEYLAITYIELIADLIKIAQRHENLIQQLLKKDNLNLQMQERSK